MTKKTKLSCPQCGSQKLDWEQFGGMRMLRADANGRENYSARCAECRTTFDVPKKLGMHAVPRDVDPRVAAPAPSGSGLDVACIATRHGGGAVSLSAYVAPGNVGSLRVLDVGKTIEDLRAAITALQGGDGAEAGVRAARAFAAIVGHNQLGAR